MKAKLYHSLLLPGEYTLSTAMTQVEMLDYLSEEGQKNQELSDKKILKETETETSSTDDSNVIGDGNESE